MIHEKQTDAHNFDLFISRLYDTHLRIHTACHDAEKQEEYSDMTTVYICLHSLMNCSPADIGLSAVTQCSKPDIHPNLHGFTVQLQSVLTVEQAALLHLSSWSPYPFKRLLIAYLFRLTVKM